MVKFFAIMMLCVHCIRPLDSIRFKLFIPHLVYYSAPGIIFSKSPENLMTNVLPPRTDFLPCDPKTVIGDNSEVAMKTQGEMEAAICEGVSRFEQDYMGRGPKEIHAHLVGDLLVVRLQGVLTAAEQQLVKSLSADKGRDLLKQVRTHLIETARSIMETMVQEITGVKVLTLHHDISTVTGEEVVLFTLAESPCFREAKKK
jgi:uncharacterized protein YbcI